MAKIQFDFYQTMNLLGDGELTEQEKLDNVTGWVTDAADDFFSDVQSNDATMYTDMIVSSGDAEYQKILDSLPSGRQSSIINGTSLYVRNENVKHVCSDTQWTKKTTCLAEGTCDTGGTTYANNQVDCEANGGTFTSAGNTWEAIAPNFIINKGTIYKFGSDKQFNLAYHQLIKKTSIKMMEHHQSLSPNSSRASLITKKTQEYQTDTAVFSADASATWSAGDLADSTAHADLLYQPTKKGHSL